LPDAEISTLATEAQPLDDKETDTMTTAVMKGAPPERDGFVLEQGFSYSRDHWTSRLPNADQWPPSLDGGPVRGKWPVLDRRGVFALEDVQSPEDAVHLYVAACVWDSGLSGRKASRLARVLRDNPDAGRNLLAAITTMREHGPVPAYSALHPGGTHSLLGLGPGLVSKFLYFAGWNLSGGDNQPLILDQFVVIALNDQIDLGWKLDGKWSSDQHATYLDLAHDWAAEWKGTSTDVVERVLFEHGKRLSKMS
jgi:hypothetical protein